MSRRFLLVTSLIALGVVIGGYLRSSGGSSSRSSDTVVARRVAPLSPPVARVPQAEMHQVEQQRQVEQQLKALRGALEAEIGERRRLQDRLDGLSQQLAALRAPGGEGLANVPAEAPPAQEEARAGSEAPAANEAPNFTERALIAAGVEPTEAARIKRQMDEFTLAQMYLRDQAGREGWADSARFAEEMAELERQSPSIRDEIGDDVYDRYLAASGQPNRVTVNEVLVESPAAQAGLQPGDVVLRYGDMRIFAPSELVSETRGGEAGETVRIEVLRQGQRVAVDVPRGPLGIRIAASQGQPDDG